MPIEWTDDLSVGVELIDQQHRELFERINRLLSAMKCVPFFIVEDEEHGAQELMETMSFLQEYVAQHFATEEERMVLYEYPGLAKHKEHHEYFRGRVEDLQRRLSERGPDEKLLVEAQELLVNWLRDHILQVDMVMGRFFKEKYSGIEQGFPSAQDNPTSRYPQSS